MPLDQPNINTTPDSATIIYMFGNYSHPDNALLLVSSDSGVNWASIRSLPNNERGARYFKNACNR